jgi:hypothetical protein
MSSFTLQPVDGEQRIVTRNSGDLYHDLALRAVGPAPVGTLTLTGRKAGSDVFETIPDGTFDLSALNSIQFTGGVAEYKIDITGSSGIISLYLTDTSQRA